MKQGWKPGIIGIHYQLYVSKEEKRRIEELGEILYSYFSQLERDSTETTASDFCEHRRIVADA